MNAPFIRKTTPFDLQGLERIVGNQAIRRLRLLARKVQKEFRREDEPLRLWHINSSAVGGGVADILNSLVPLSNEIGISTQWLVIGGDQSFFKVTKAFHNSLQGSSHEKVTEAMLSHYRSVTESNVELLRRLFKKQRWNAPDVIVVHDPQPAGLIPFLRDKFPESIFIWRGHIQFDLTNLRPSDPGRRVWEFLLDYINQCDGTVFHLPEMVPPGITVPVRYILPSINPLGFINRDLSTPAAAQFIRSTLSKYGLEHFQDRSVPLLVQNARFDPWKDPTGVIQAVREARERLSQNSKRPELVLVGPLAEDDPEANEILAQLGELRDGDGAVHLLPMNPTNKLLTPEQKDALNKIGLDPDQLSPEDLMELEINAFQTRADIIIAKSLREGFGLTVTGAGYHGKPRIVSHVGGLPVQVTDGDGKHTAALVGGAPEFTREASIDMTRDWIIKLLTTPKLRKAMGAKAKQHVIENFLPHRHLADYLKLFFELRSMKASLPPPAFSPDKVPTGDPRPAI
jgi:trehalose synthase